MWVTLPEPWLRSVTKSRHASCSAGHTTNATRVSNHTKNEFTIGDKTCPLNTTELYSMMNNFRVGRSHTKGGHCGTTWQWTMMMD